MTSESLGDSQQDTRLNAILADFIQQSEADRNPDPDEFIARHPEFAAELNEFFSDKARFDRMAQPFQPQLEPGSPRSIDEATLLSSDAQAGSGVAKVPGIGSRLRYFGDYELLEEIARGGMGVVYKARQSTLKRIVALKMILTGQLASSDDVKRFYAEAEAAAKLEHPNIVPIFEIGQAESQHYFSMAFVEGESLAHRVVREVIAPKEAAKLMQKVARAIAYAHIEGVVHRDLKPANILLDKSGEPHVTDFGLAKRFETAGPEHEAASQLTATGQILGTPSYMPPEQASGRAKEIGPLADVYSLGAVLYCLITGRPPFQAASPLDTLLQVIERDPVAPRLLNPSIPRDLETICLKCLNKEPRQRYGSAAELADDLERFVKDEPITARPPDVFERTWRWAKKQQRSVALTAIVVVATLLLGTVGVATWFWYQDWRLGYVALGTDLPPLAAEILDDSGQPVAKAFTVPTQEPVPVPAADYWLRLSAAGRMSQSYRLSVQRGASTAPMRHSLNMEDQLLGPTLPVDRSYAIIQRNGRADVLLLDANGIRCPAGLGNMPAFSIDLSKPAENPALSDAPGLRWPWNFQASNPEVSFHVFHPQVIANAPDLDGDGLEDVIVAARHQAWIMAISSSGGGVLWVAARGSDLTAEAAKNRPAWYGSNPGAVLGEPRIINDVDGDGVAELIAVFADEQGKPDAPQRWIECLSGRSGKMFWRFDLKDEFFQLPADGLWSQAARWMTRINGYSSFGTGESGSSEDFMASRPSWELSGDWHPAPFAPQLVQASGKLTLVVVAGRHVFSIDPATGNLARDPFDVGGHPVREPQFADLDGDGEKEIVCLEQIPSDVATSNPGAPRGRGMKLTTWSMSGRRMNWRRELTSEWPSPRSPESVPVEWPMLADLDGDGRSELIVPTESQIGKAPWGALEVLDGRNGDPLWRRRIKTIDQQLDKFLVGPDIDSDGYRDIFVVSFCGQKYELFIDGLSGRDGKSVLRSNRQFGANASPPSIGLMHWWQSGDDSWPRLLVELLPEYRENVDKRVICSFASNDGRFMGSISGIEQVRFGDADADGLPDLFALQPNNGRDPDAGGKLQVLHAEPTERWRRLGGALTPGADYDGDGNADLVGFETGIYPLLSAVSGIDGHQVWETPFDNQYADNAIPLQTDLDGDGTQDIVTLRSATQHVTAGISRKEFPVAAVSGRTGSILWTVPLPFTAIERVLFVDAKDLDGDGVAEITFSAMTDWDYDNTVRSGTNLMQHWLAVVSGRTGEVRWRQPLSVAYGKPGQPENRSYDIRTTDIRPAYGDLNSDGILDLVILAETFDSPNECELRALNGRDGETMWHRKLGRAGREAFMNRGQLEEAVSPVIVDLDGDGKLEVIGLDYVLKKVPPPTGKTGLSVIDHQAQFDQPQRHANLFVLNAADGLEKWAVQIAVEEQCGQVNSNQANLANKPKPFVLRTSQGQPLLALNLWGYSDPGRIVLLTNNGKQLGQMLVQPEYSAFQPWVHDVDGDGTDELLVINAGKVQAVRANADMSVLWEWALPQGNSYFRQILGVIPASNDRPAVVAVQSSSTVFGLFCHDGKVTWINLGPQLLTSSGSMKYTSAALLSSTVNGLPRVLFQFGDQLAACRDARDFTAAHLKSFSDDAEKLTAVATTSKPVAGLSESPHASQDVRARSTNLPEVSPDPRLIRRPEWSVGEGERARAFRVIGWGTLMSLFIMILPGWTLFRMIQRRRWGLRSVFLLAVLATLVFVLLRVPGPANFEPTSHSRPMIRIFTAIQFLPIPVFSLLLVHLAHARHWRLLSLCGASVILFAAFIVVISLVSDFRRLGPDEHLALTDWDIPLCYGFYAVGWLATFVVARIAVGRTIRSRSPMPAR